MKYICKLIIKLKFDVDQAALLAARQAVCKAVRQVGHSEKDSINNDN